RALARRRVGERQRPAPAAPAVGEPRLGGAAGGAPGVRRRRHGRHQPRFPEPRGDGAGRPGGRAGGAPTRGAVVDLGRLRARPARARAGGRGLAGRLRRVREGALAAVPDLADPGRAAGSWAARAVGDGAARGRARPHPALVPVSLLGPGEPPRPDVLVARPGPRPRAGHACRGPRATAAAPRLETHDTETRIASQLVARPSAPHSTSTPSIRTSPAAVSNRTGIPVRMLRIASSAITPITESWGPVMPASVIAAVPPR